MPIQGCTPILDTDFDRITDAEVWAWRSRTGRRESIITASFDNVPSSFDNNMRAYPQNVGEPIPLYAGDRR